MHHCYQFAHAQEERHRTLKETASYNDAVGDAAERKAGLSRKHAFLLEVEVKSVLFPVAFHLLWNTPEGKSGPSLWRWAPVWCRDNEKSQNMQLILSCVTHESLLCTDHISSSITELLYMSFRTAFLGKKCMCFCLWTLVCPSGWLEL